MMNPKSSGKIPSTPRNMPKPKGGPSKAPKQMKASPGATKPTSKKKV